MNGYRGRHRPGQHRRRHHERYERPGGKCLPAAALLARLVAERPARGSVPVDLGSTAVYPADVVASLIRPYVGAGVLPLGVPSAMRTRATAAV